MRPLPCSLSLLASLLLGCAPAAPPPSAPVTATAEIPAPVAPPAAEPDPGAAPAPEEAATPPEAPAAPLDDEAARARILAGIRRVKDERYEVTREALDLMLDDLDRVTWRGEFKVTPAERAGQVVSRLQSARLAREATRDVDGTLTVEVVSLEEAEHVLTEQRALLLGRS